METLASEQKMAHQYLICLHKSKTSVAVNQRLIFTKAAKSNSCKGSNLMGVLRYSCLGVNF